MLLVIMIMYHPTTKNALIGRYWHGETKDRGTRVALELYRAMLTTDSVVPILSDAFEEIAVYNVVRECDSIRPEVK